MFLLRVLASVFLFHPPSCCFYVIKYSSCIHAWCFCLTALLSAPSGRPGYCSLQHPPPGKCPPHLRGARLLLPLLRWCASIRRLCDFAAFITHDLETHDLKARPLIYLYSRFLLFFFPFRCSQDFSFTISSVFRILFPGGTHFLSMGLLATNSPFFFFWKCLHFPWIPEGSFLPDLLPPFQPWGNGPTDLCGV